MQVQIQLEAHSLFPIYNAYSAVVECKADLYIARNLKKKIYKKT